MTTKWKVAVLEFERGWGSRVDSISEFETYDLALAFQRNFNSKNTNTTVPDWYMTADTPYPVEEK